MSKGDFEKLGGLNNLLKEAAEIEQFGMRREQYYNVKQTFKAKGLVLHVQRITCRHCGHVGESQHHVPDVEAQRTDRNSADRVELPISEFHSRELQNLPRRLEIHDVTSNGCHHCMQFQTFQGDFI